MKCNGRLRVTVLTNILSPYRVPLYQRLGRKEGLDVTVILLAESEANRQWELDLQTNGFATQVLPGKSLYVWRWELPIHLNRGLGKALKTQDPHVVMVSGWDQPGYWQAAWWCRRYGVPLVLHNGSTLASGLRRGKPWMAMRSTMVRMASSYVAYGSKAQEYLLQLGAPPDRIHVGFNTVDVEAFATAVKEERDKPETRELRILFPPVLLLYVGQLNSRKRVDLVLRALTSMGADDMGLLVVGSGPEEANLRALAARLGLKNVYFEGFHQPSALPHYYALADALVLPSDREVWGLVVNEALAAGLYVIASDQVAAAYDTIHAGWNGDIFSAGNATELADRLGGLQRTFHEVNQRSDDIAADVLRRLSIETTAQAFVAAFRQAGGLTPDGQ